MKNIVFLVSANKTVIFKEVAKKLENDGYSSYWITPSQKWNKWLLDQGIAQSRILNLPDKVSVSNKGRLSSGEIERISRIENAANVSFSDLYFMDRVLRKKDYHYSFRYMLTCFDEISNFIKDNDVKSVFSEQTWNFEIITSIACNSIGINSYYIDGVKVPDGKDVGRFAFFQGSLLDKLPQSIKADKENFEFAEKIIDK